MKQGQLRDYTLQIEPGSQVRVQATGEYFRIIDADGANIRVSTSAGDALQVREGEGARVQPFTELRFENLDSVARRVVALVGSGEFESGRVLGVVTLNPAGTAQAVGAFTGGQTIPANPGRREITIRAAVANAGEIVIAGIPLQPGDTYTLQVTGAIAVEGATTDTAHAGEVV